MCAAYSVFNNVMHFPS